MDRVDADLGAFGVWVFQNNSFWFQLHPSSPRQIVSGDIN